MLNSVYPVLGAGFPTFGKLTNPTEQHDTDWKLAEVAPKDVKQGNKVVRGSSEACVGSLVKTGAIVFTKTAEYLNIAESKALLIEASGPRLDLTP